MYFRMKKFKKHHTYSKSNLFKKNQIQDISKSNLNTDIIKLYKLDEIQYKIEPMIQKNNNMIISLTTVPNRLYCDDFKKVLKCLTNQTLKPKMIILNICLQYNNHEQKIKKEDSIFNHIRNMGIHINFCNDMGPITKILGLCSMDTTLFNPDDKIIVVDDDWLLNRHFVFFYHLIYELYMCDGVGIDEQKNIHFGLGTEIILKHKKTLFYDNYQGFLYGWMTFSLRYKWIHKILDFYNKIINQDKRIIIHDDLILTLFYKHNHLHICGINYAFHLTINNRLQIESNGLRSETKCNIKRYNIEKDLLKKYNIEYKVIHNRIEIQSNLLNYNNTHFYHNNSKKRYFSVVKNINPLAYPKGNIPNYNLNFVYMDEHNALMTVQSYDKMFPFYIDCIIANKQIRIPLKSNRTSLKQSFIINTKENLVKQIYNYDLDDNVCIISTDERQKTNHYKLYANMSYMMGLPNMRYQFFSHEQRESFIFTYFGNIILNLYKKLIPGAYKADLFRILYLYKYGGLYHDIKSILVNYNYFHSFIFSNKSLLVKDIGMGIYNAIMFFKKPKNDILKKVLLGNILDFEKIKLKQFSCGMIQNILSNYYGDSCLDITGPRLLGKFINNKHFKLNNKFTYDWKKSYIIDIDNNISIMKNCFPSYYNDNQYLNNKHYSILWKQKNVFNSIENIISIQDFFKNSNISCIQYINLDRSLKRNNDMIRLLSHINIPFFRINALDGSIKENITKILNRDNIKNIRKGLTHYEIACTLSHIKAISQLEDKKGDYFMICEDDITFNNLILSYKSISQIIKESSKFDILMLSKIFHIELDKLYVSWNHYYSNLHKHIAGTACYIISREGVKKFIKTRGYYDEEKNKFVNINTQLLEADKYIYQNMNTITYKYNFIRCNDKESTIHKDHIYHHQKCTLIQDNIMIRDICNLK